MMKNYLSINSFILLLCLLTRSSTTNRLVVNTWAFTEANDQAWQKLTTKGQSALDAVEAGCSRCEQLQCDGSVGFGSHPDEANRVTLDAMVFDGATHRVGAVASLYDIKQAISVARQVLEHSEHTLLVGKGATKFALAMGFTRDRLETNNSQAQFDSWQKADCQPNYWRNVQPDPTKSCGPYKPIELRFASSFDQSQTEKASSSNHDTIGMIAIDSQNNIAVGTSTNGMNHKIPGRVADTAIPGAGGYADNDIGAAACTGDGDIIMRFAPAFHAVTLLSAGISPEGAAELALSKMASKFPNNMAAIVVANADGEFGAACYGAKSFPYSVRNESMSEVQVFTVDCFQP